MIFTCLFFTIFILTHFYLSIKGNVFYKKNIKMDNLETLSDEEKDILNNKMFKIGNLGSNLYVYFCFGFTFLKLFFFGPGVGFFPIFIIYVVTFLIYGAIHISNGEYILYKNLTKYKQFFSLYLFTTIVVFIFWTLLLGIIFL